MNDRERGDVGVPLQQRGRAAGEPMSEPVQFPDRVNDMIIVRVDPVETKENNAK